MKKPNIRFKSVLDPIKSISKRNKAFNELSDEGKRLEIAWDALKLVEAGRIKASYGYYWDDKLHDIAKSSDTSEEFQKKLNVQENIESCSVCARGSIMLSLIRLGNSVDPSDSWVSEGDDNNIKGFSMDSMYNMENGYENSRFYHPYKCNTEEKLMNILCNVLINGDFNPKDKNDYLI